MNETGVNIKDTDINTDEADIDVTDIDAQISSNISFWQMSYIAFLLRVKGYTVIARRYLTTDGMIPIVALKKDTIVFMEIIECAEPKEIEKKHISSLKKRTVKASKYYFSQNPYHSKLKRRYDVFVISSPFSWRHIANT